MYMFNCIHLYNNYLIHVIYFVLCSAVEPMTTLSWQLCKQACYQVGYGYSLVNKTTTCFIIIGSNTLIMIEVSDIGL